MSVAEDILVQADALKTGHFQYASGRHGRVYIDKNAATSDGSLLNLLTLEIARRFVMDDIGVVIGPATGGAIMAVYVAHHLSKLTSQSVAFARADKTIEGHLELSEEEIRKARHLRALVVDDILTTGGSLQKTIRASTLIGCRVVGACVLVNRGGVTASQVEGDTGVKNLHLDALVSMDLESWSADECPLCKQGVPMNTDLGHASKPK